MKKFIHIGAANWGLHWIKNVIPKNTDIAECVAVVDVVPEFAENGRIYLDLPPEKCYTDLDKALRENAVDFVTIASAIPSHEAVVNTVLKYGCHILSEKPLAHDMAACCRLYNAVKSAGIKFAVTMSHRYENDKQTFEALLRSGKYGNINYIISRLHMSRNKWKPSATPTPGRGERGIEYMLIDGGVHNMDMIRAFTGSNAKKVYADIWNFEPGGGRDEGRSAFVRVDMENGVNAFLEYSFGGAFQLNSWSNEYFRAECADAMVEVDNQKITVRSYEGFPLSECAEIPLLKGDRWIHDLLMKQFVDWISGGEPPAVTIDDNMNAMAMMFSAVESFKTGVPVMVEDFWNRI